jgi:hypothetical protein
MPLKEWILKEKQVKGEGYKCLVPIYMLPLFWG